MKQLAVVFVLFALFPAAARADRALAVGQVWSIKATPPTPARVIIGRIEPWGDGKTAVSISVVDVPTDQGPVMLPHAPYDAAALAGSLDQLVATGRPSPNGFETGYQAWKDAHGGVFTVPVDKMVAMILDQARAAGGHLPPSPPDAP